MRRYETIFILRPSRNEKEIDAIVEMTTGIIEETGGKIIEIDKWGMRKLAYPIKKETQGFYVFIDYSATPDVISEIERRYRIDDSVLRYMTVKLSDAITDEEIEEAREKASARKLDAEKEREAEEAANNEEGAAVAEAVETEEAAEITPSGAESEAGQDVAETTREDEE